MITSDLIGATMKDRTDNDFNIQDLINSIDKLKIMMYLRDSEDCPIFNSAQEVFLEKPPGEKYLCSRRFMKGNSAQILFTDKDEVTFEQKISIAQKHIDDARYDIITRFIQVLISSIGTAVENYIVINIPRANIKKFNKSFFNNTTIVSPELYDENYRAHKDNAYRISYSLKDCEFITVDHKSPPEFVVIEDMLVVNKGAAATEITAKLTLRFSLEGIVLCVAKGNKND